MPKPTPRRCAAYPFFDLDSAGTSLFQVSPEASTKDALEQASCFLSAAADLVADQLCNLPAAQTSDGAWAGYYLLQLAHGIVDAVVSAEVRGENHV